ncbi:MAG: DUF2786 domain-containing protein, partial [Aeromicrobium sp.]
SSERREARRRAHQRATRVGSRSSATGSPGQADGTEQAQILELIELATRYAVNAPRALGPRVQVLNEIGAVAPSPHHDPAALVVDEALSMIRTAWEHGWQPLDLVHATRRRASKGAAGWIARAVLVEGDRTRASDRAPQAWSDQLAALASGHRRPAGPDDLLAPRGEASEGDWLVALLVIDLLHTLPATQMLMPPPSRWGLERPSRPTSPQHGEQRAKMLAKVRSLLAKAESTEFTAEAEAFTAKAQDLMTRHAIDEALLAADAGESFDVQGVRVLIDQPYGAEKATLMHVVAEANRVRAVWNDYASYVTLVGLPADVEQVDMLFTSTLVQATKAMTLAVVSGAAFRRAFLHAFAVRIGERLTASSEEAVASYGSALVPVLARQEEAVAEEVDRLFPHLTSGSRRRQLDARGWHAGTRAADAAVLPAGAVEA